MAYTKQTWDTTSYVNPTRMNHIEDGIRGAVDWDSNKILGAKNLNARPYTHPDTRTYNGVTWTVNADGSITANGTATGGNSQFQCHPRISTGANPLVLPNGKYIVSGCPSGGSGTKYFVQILATINGTANVYAYEYGAGREFTLNGDDYSPDCVTLGVYLYIVDGQTVNNITFKPMVRVASDDDATWTEGAMTNRQLTEKVNQTPLLLTQDNLSTTATSYPCSWAKYSMLNITLGNNNNVVNQILVPISEFTSSSTSRRVILYFMPITSSTYSAYEIYKNDDSNVYIKATNPDSSHRIKIYGVL